MKASESQVSGVTAEQAITAAIVQHRIARTNTPPEVLAAHMLASLSAFEDSLLARAAHPFYSAGSEAGRRAIIARTVLHEE